MIAPRYRRLGPPEAPTIEGPTRAAWSVHEQLERLADRPTAGISTWYLLAPDAHPIFPLYAIAGVHLRWMPGVPDPELHHPNATHEVSVWVLSPEAALHVDVIPLRLSPPNVVEQFRAEDDDAAAARIADAVERCVLRKLSPDSDHASLWSPLFSVRDFGSRVSLRKR